MGIAFMILVPHKDNSGRTFARAYHEAFERRARELFGGYTNLGTTHGSWTDKSGTVYDDDCTRYEVMVPSILDAARVRAFAAFAAKHYAQDAIYVSALGVSECFEPNWREKLLSPLPLDAFEQASEHVAHPLAGEVA